MINYKYILLVLIIIVKLTQVFGQTDSLRLCECNKDTLVVFVDPEKIATFVGGDKELFKFININLRYPEEAIKSKHEDKVISRFCVRENGEITDVRILKGKYEELNNEVLRLVYSMPNWEPAISRGKKICMEYTLPFNFSLKSKQELKKLQRERRR